MSEGKPRPGSALLRLITRQLRYPSHVFVSKGESGLTLDSYLKVENIHAISKERHAEYKGDLRDARIGEVERRLRVLLGL
ncbi:MAG TPA: type II toxin-antitoxin system PemK/MazF family toxin [Gemmatimonadaceae bacterium]|nr:type II toxin-antitoxin system PemK/MazF family toxin [Gemmatimonadaceae bacterium]